MVAYLYLASDLWVLALEFGEPGGPGDAFFSLLVLWPILGLFAIFDAAALAVIIRRRQALATCTWFAVAALWASVILFNKFMSFNIIELRFT